MKRISVSRGREYPMKSISCGLLLLALSGCTSSFEKVRTAAAGAPEWYDAAREEIIGEGYPDLGSMPELSGQELRGSERSLRLSLRDIAAARQLFASERATAPYSTEIEMRALKDRLRAKLAASGPAPTGTSSDLFLTEADIDRFREIFRRAEQR